MTDTPQDETLLEFPCQYPIKILGPGTTDFEALVVDLINKHVDTKVHSIKSNYSKSGRYCSITVTFEATSKAQLDALYEVLCKQDMITMVL